MKIFTLLAASALAVSMNAQIVDGSFEAFADPATSGWAQASTNYGTPLCDVACSGGTNLAYDGAIWAWFGGAAVGAEELGSLSQQALIPAGTNATITFWAFVVGGEGIPASEHVDFYIDGQILLGISAADSADFAAWTEVTVDVSDFADGDAHTLGFNGYAYEGSNIFIDAVTLTVDGTDYATVGELMDREQSVVVYPNPANEEINMQFNHKVEGAATVRIFDMNGRIVSQQNLPQVWNTNFKYNTSNLESGLYIIELENNGEVSQHRFSVAH
jgi:hypothetical protein